MMGESSMFNTLKEIRVLVDLDCFSKYLKYLRNIEKWSKFTKSSIFLGVVIGLLSPITLSQVKLFSDLKLIVKLIFLILTPV